MALTQISTNGIKNSTITGTDLATNLDLGDNRKIRLGTGNDLQIYHDGSHSFIEDSGTGQLRVLSNQFRVHNAADTETMIAAFQEGGVKLMYDNTSRLETISTGAKVNGSLFEVENTGGNANFEVTKVSGASFRIQSQTSLVRLDTIGASHPMMLGTNGNGRIQINDSTVDLLNDNQRLRIGASQDLQIYHDGTNSYVNDTGTGVLRITSNQVQVTNAAANEVLANFIENGAVELYYNNSKKFETTSTGTRTTGVSVVGANAVGMGSLNAATQFVVTNLSGNNNSVDLTILGGRTGKSSVVFGDHDDVNVGAVRYNHSDESIDFLNNNQTTSKLIITSGGNLQIPNDSVFLQIGAGQDLDLHHNGTNSYMRNKTGNLHIRPLVAEEGIILKPNGAVELYHDNSKKFETTSTGVDVTGSLSVANHITLPDQASGVGKIKMGDGVDFQIYHNGTHSVIENRTGSLLFYNNTNELAARFVPNGAVDLYYDNSKKFHTKNSGVYITGDIETSGDFYMLDNEKIRIGNSQDLELYHDSSSSVIKNLTNDLYVQSIADIKIRTNDSELAVDCTVNGSVALYYDASKKFETNANGVSVVGTNGSNPTIGINHSNADVTGEVVRLKRTDLPTIRYHSIMAQHGGAAGSNFIDFKLHDGSTTTSQSSVLKLFGSKIVHVDDNVKLDIGTGSDLQIYHNGSHSIAKNGTGDFYLAGDSVKLVNAAINEDMLVAEANGAVKLYFNNGQKFETRSDGVKLSQGHFYADDHSRIKLGDGQDLELYHDGTNSSLKNTTGDLYIYDTGGNIYIQANTPEQSIIAFANGSTELYYDNSIRIRTQSYGIEYYNQQHKFMHTNSGGVGAYLSLINPGTAAGGKTGIVFGIGNSNAILDGTDYGEGQIKCFTDSGYYGNLEFNLHVGANRSWMKIVGNGAAYNGAGAGSEGMRGGVAFGCAGIAIDRSWTGQPGIHVFNQNTEGDTDQGTFRFHGWNRSYASYPNNSGSDFSVNLVADGTGLSSDERRKTGIATITNALDTITKMRGVSFQFVNRELDPQTHMSMDNGKKLGFIAQEVIPLLPQLILDSGEKNVPLENGWCDRYSMDYSGVTAVLVEAIKELAAKVASLESKITE